MFMRKSQIKNTILKAVDVAEKRRDEFWRNKLEEEITKIESSYLIKKSADDAEIHSLINEINRLKKDFKDSNKKYNEGKMLIQKSTNLINAVVTQFQEIFDKDTGYLQSFLRIKEIADDAERKFLTMRE